MSEGIPGRGLSPEDMPSALHWGPTCLCPSSSDTDASMPEAPPSTGLPVLVAYTPHHLSAIVPPDHSPSRPLSTRPGAQEGARDPQWWAGKVRTDAYLEDFKKRWVGRLGPLFPIVDQDSFQTLFQLFLPRKQ